MEESESLCQESTLHPQVRCSYLVVVQQFVALSFQGDLPVL